MHTDDLKAVWICNDCHATFLFHEDSEAHIRDLGHTKVTAYDIATGKPVVDKSSD